MAAISWYQMTGDMVKFTEIFRVLIVAGNTPVVTYNDTNMSLNKKKKKHYFGHVGPTSAPTI